MDVINQNRILNEVAAERRHQYDKWGDQIHTVSHWMSILEEEIGEAEKEAVEFEAKRFKAKHPDFILEGVRAELIQAAAVAVAIVEWIDEGATYPPWYENLTPEFIRQFVEWYNKHCFPDRVFGHEKIAEFKPERGNETR